MTDSATGPAPADSATTTAADGDPVDLLVIGAGPKAVALAARAAALRATGLPAPRIRILEARAVGAHWERPGGWTNGNLLLGTAPEKDVGFPYATAGAGAASAAVDGHLAQWSWTRFLIAAGDYAAWVDRGRPAPTHATWARYLRWVADRAGAQVRIGRVIRAGVAESGAGWAVTARGADGVERVHRARALLPTGPGPAATVIAMAPRVYSQASFWSVTHMEPVFGGAEVAVIGSGEGSANTVAQLLRVGAAGVTVISPDPAIFTRGENRFENRLYSEPERWTALSAAHRRDILRRTDRGVYSAAMMTAIESDLRFDHVTGWVRTAVPEPDGVQLMVARARPGEGAGPAAEDSVIRVDYVVDARGNPPLWFLRYFTPAAREALADAAGGTSPEAVEQVIDRDLSVAGMRPRLFLPALAGFRQGPGFANLSCLGALSDRVLTGLAAEAGTAPALGAGAPA
ncbi:SidA/IucD/PvdA family monooxygenase [Corynebacterium sphenisci]|uniref:SidA/IucD/PvdA family monooxygenase n=1 Tax=Corynebacterium sphenisci TaxID=191493 RepID=UPI0026DEF6DA|nr:SidA/IucD/PvdA family monooxygenase [Corynebacterium sphenisci]MDO5731218.1 SidA/IucD/PvdA family monooxygenase [Corynebacterium sphenisci]